MLTVSEDKTQVSVPLYKSCQDAPCFQFDGVYDSQGGLPPDSLYSQHLLPLVEGLMQGYNTAIMAYGATGSGKSFTLGTGGGDWAAATQAAPSKAWRPAPPPPAPALHPGLTPVKCTTGDDSSPSSSGEWVGVSQRAISDIMSRVSSARASGSRVVVVCSFVEVYQDSCRDLLAHRHTAHKQGGGQRPPPALAIRDPDPTQDVILVGVEEVVCDDACQLLQCLADGCAARATAATLCNNHSSRSHAIFSIQIRQHRKVERDLSNHNSGRRCHDSSSSFWCEEEVITSKLQLVDLAGSERVGLSGAAGARLQEACAINQGLLALGHVITALCSAPQRTAGGGCASPRHVPYRDHLLTRLLRHCLGGSARTLLLACASPADITMNETINTLRWASRARDVRNRPVMNRHSSSRDSLAALRAENDMLRSQIASLESEMDQLLGAGDEEGDSADGGSSADGEVTAIAGGSRGSVDGVVTVTLTTVSPPGAESGASALQRLSALEAELAAANDRADRAEARAAAADAHLSELMACQCQLEEQITRLSLTTQLQQHQAGARSGAAARSGGMWSPCFTDGGGAGCDDGCDGGLLEGLPYTTSAMQVPGTPTIAFKRSQSSPLQESPSDEAPLAPIPFNHLQYHSPAPQDSCYEGDSRTFGNLGEVKPAPGSPPRPRNWMSRLMRKVSWGLDAGKKGQEGASRAQQGEGLLVDEGEQVPRSLPGPQQTLSSPGNLGMAEADGPGGLSPRYHQPEVVLGDAEMSAVSSEYSGVQQGFSPEQSCQLLPFPSLPPLPEALPTCDEGPQHWAPAQAASSSAAVTHPLEVSPSAAAVCAAQSQRSEAVRLLVLSRLAQADAEEEARRLREQVAWLQQQMGGLLGRGPVQAPAPSRLWSLFRRRQPA